MATDGKRIHFGFFLRKKRESLGLSRSKVGKAADVTERRLAQIEEMEAPSSFGQTLEMIAKALNLTIEELDKGWRTTPVSPPSRIKKSRIPAPAPAPFDENIDPYSETKIGEIPTFDLDIAAGPWVELDGGQEGAMPNQACVDAGLFRVRIRGDSMKPEFTEGKTIEFRCLRDGRDKLEVGHDYYIQKRDGTATLKRLGAMDDESVTLLAINKRKYPAPMVVDRREIVRMAIALGEFVPRRGVR